jgi:hypothetical protein
MPHQVFISYSARDREAAEAVVAALELRSVPCWVAPRDVPPAVPFAESIVQAIQKTRALVLVLTEAASSSTQVLREVQQASERRIPVVEFRAAGVRPSDALEYYLSPNHRIEWDTPIEAHLPELVGRVRGLLNMPTTRAADLPQPPRLSLALKSRNISCSVVVLCLLLAPTACLRCLAFLQNQNYRARVVELQRANNRYRS